MEGSRDPSDSLQQNLSRLWFLCENGLKKLEVRGIRDGYLSPNVSVRLRWPEGSPEEQILGRFYSISLFEEDVHEYMDTTTGEKKSHPATLELTFNAEQIDFAGITPRNWNRALHVRDEQTEMYVDLLLQGIEEELSTNDWHS